MFAKREKKVQWPLVSAELPGVPAWRSLMGLLSKPEPYQLINTFETLIVVSNLGANAWEDLVDAAM